MRINSKNMFPRVVSKEKRLNSIEKRILRKEQRLIEKFQSPVQTTKFFDIGFQKGFQEGEDEGYKRGYERGYSDQNEDLEAENAKLRQEIADKENKTKRSDKPEKREYGGPVTKGKPYLVGEAGVEGFMPKGPIPDLPGLGGGGGGTDAITSKAKTKTMGNYMKDALKISTIPARFLLNIKSPEDPLSKFASPSTPEDKVSSAISNYVQAESNNNEFGSITSSMVNKPRVQTVVQPVIQTKTQQVSVPVPMSSKTQVIKTTKSKLPPSIAKMIN